MVLTQSEREKIMMIESYVDVISLVKNMSTWRFLSFQVR